ncbi:MAG: tetratricopeptide repeat protein [Kofleriaceae bacterium]
MRALLVVLLLCELARAAPKYSHAPLASKDAAVLAAERKWTVAAASRGPAQSDLWEDTAVAFVEIAEAGTLPVADLALASHAALAAFKNALNVDPRIREHPPKEFDPDFARIPAPQALTPRDQRLIRVLDIVARFETNADEIASLAFQRASVWRRYDHFDKAIPIFLDIVANHPAHEVAEFSANHVLDAYNRQQRYGELVAFASKLRENKVLLAKRPELVRTVHHIYTQSLRREAEGAEQRAKTTGDLAFFDQCGDAYLSILDTAADRHDELLYNALVCFEEGGSYDRASEVLRRMTKRFPGSQLTMRGELRLLGVLERTGRIDEVATLAERWLSDHPLETHALEVLEDVIHWRQATGDLDVAVRIFDDFARRVRTVPLVRERTALVGVTLAGLLLDDGAATHASDGAVPHTSHAANASQRTSRAGAAYARRRAEAVRIVSRPPSLARSFASDTRARVEIATIVATAACPVPLVDGLCPRVRDPSVMSIARRELSRVQHPNDTVTLLLADLALEAILAKRAPTANLDADYRHLTGSADPDVRVAARARLAAFAEHSGDGREHATQLDACIADAFASRAGDVHVAICLRERAAVASPRSSSPARDLLPQARAPAPFAIEAPRLPAPPPSRTKVFDFPDDVIE